MSSLTVGRGAAVTGKLIDYKEPSRGNPVQPKHCVGRCCVVDIVWIDPPGDNVPAACRDEEVAVAYGSAGRTVLSRHLAILDSFDVQSPFLTLAQISRRSGLRLSTTHRLLAELESQGLVERSGDRVFRLGLRLWELASRTPGALGIRELADPHLRELHAVIGQHVQLGVLSGDDVLFIDRLSTRDAVVNVTMVGGRLPLHASSSGLVLLAHSPREFQERILSAPMPKYTDATIQTPAELRRVLHRIRSDGFIVGDGFIHLDARGIAVPITGPDQTVIAAISAVVPNDKGPTLPVVQDLKATASGIEEALLLAYLPANDPRAAPGGQLRPLVNSSLSSMEYLAAERRGRSAAPSDQRGQTGT